MRHISRNIFRKSNSPWLDTFNKENNALWYHIGERDFVSDIRAHVSTWDDLSIYSIFLAPNISVTDESLFLKRISLRRQGDFDSSEKLKEFEF